MLVFCKALLTNATATPMVTYVFDFACVIEGNLISASMFRLNAASTRASSRWIRERTAVSPKQLTSRVRFFFPLPRLALSGDKFLMLMPMLSHWNPPQATRKQPSPASRPESRHIPGCFYSRSDFAHICLHRRSTHPGR